ncbi:phage replication protein [Escherichia coli]|nr:phage replication protein [Escherichia coli]
MTPELYRAIENRDGRALSRMSGANADQARVINPEAENLVDALFRQLRQVFPASTQTNLKTAADEKTAKQQWIAAFAEAGISQREQLSNGMTKARASASPFWPSPGQFIAWCREGKGVLGICAADVMTEYWNWRKLVFRYPTSEQYPWTQPVMYHLCIELRRRGTEGQMTESELTALAGKLLVDWEKRVMDGKPIPPVRRALAAPCVPRGKTPAQELLEKYNARKSAGLI